MSGSSQRRSSSIIQRGTWTSPSRSFVPPYQFRTRPHRNATNAIEHKRSRSKINEANRYSAAHNGVWLQVRVLPGRPVNHSGQQPAPEDYKHSNGTPMRQLFRNGRSRRDDTLHGVVRRHWGRLAASKLVSMRPRSRVRSTVRCRAARSGGSIAVAVSASLRRARRRAS